MTSRILSGLTGFKSAMFSGLCFFSVFKSIEAIDPSSDNVGPLIALASFFAIVGFFIAYHAAKTFKRVWSHADDDSEPIHALNLEGAKPEEKVAFYSRLAKIGSVAFTFLTLISAWEISKYESGKTAALEAVAPVTFIYHRFGYWPAVLFLPVVGLVCVAVLIRKGRIRNPRQVATEIGEFRAR